MVERIHQFDTGCVEVRLRLEDGSDAAAVMPLIDAEWLDLRRGDVVVVSPHAARAAS